MYRYKNIIIFFDTEGSYGFPDSPYININDNINNIISVLDNYRAKATFNICAKILYEHPDLIKNLYSEGHEIAAHGFLHENFLRCNFQYLKNIMDEIDRAFISILQKNPVGIRSPGLAMNLLSPTGYMHKIKYRGLLSKHGYKWISDNCLYPLFRQPYTNLKIKTTIYRLLTPIIARNISIFHILEIPILSPLDTMLFPPEIRFKTKYSDLMRGFRILRSFIDNSGEIFNFNFHTEIIGTGNRILLLDKILEYATSYLECKFIRPVDLI